MQPAQASTTTSQVGVQRSEWHQVDIKIIILSFVGDTQCSPRSTTQNGAAWAVRNTMIAFVLVRTRAAAAAAATRPGC